jgi:vancomycin resistance protein YoaR
VLIAVGSVVALLGLFALVDSALYYNKIHAGVTISGYPMSGLTRAEATAELTRLVKQAEKEPITLTSGDKSWAVMPADVGTRLDVTGAVSAAMDVGRDGNWLFDMARRFRLVFGKTDVPLGGTVDGELMDGVLAEVAKEIDLPPVDAGLVIDGTEVRVVEGQKGRVMDQEAVRDELKALLFSLHSTELDVPMVLKEPEILAEDSAGAVALARNMISSELVLKDGEKTWSLTPEQIGAYMDFYTEDRGGVSTLVPFLSVVKMGPFLDKVGEQVLRKPVNATWSSDGQQAWVVPGSNGRKLDRDTTAEALTEVSLKTAGRTAEVVTITTEPDRTTEEAEAMGIHDKLGGFTTEWEGTEDRQVNVRITTEYANNVLLAPGDVYDFDKQIGPRTAERGYKLAHGITGPGVLEDVLGGGICQVSTTLFNAAFFAGLEIVERKNHSIYIEHYPKGRDATVSAGSPNMRFRNDTGHYILVRGASNGIVTTFNIYGTKDGRTVSYETGEFYDVEKMTKINYDASWLGPGTTYIRMSGQDGKKIKVTRTVKAKDGTVIHDNVFLSTWKMIPQEVEVGTGSTTTTKPPTTTTTAEPATTTTTATTATTSPPTTGF